MARRIPIRLFASLRKFHYMLGIDPTQMDSKWRLNARNFIILYALIQMFISAMAFGLYEAKTLVDYCSCAFVCITELACLHEYLLHYFGIVDLLDWIKKIDDLIEKSMDTTAFLLFHC